MFTISELSALECETYKISSFNNEHSTVWLRIRNPQNEFVKIDLGERNGKEQIRVSIQDASMNEEEKNKVIERVMMFIKSHPSHRLYVLTNDNYIDFYDSTLITSKKYEFDLPF